MTRAITFLAACTAAVAAESQCGGSSISLKGLQSFRNMTVDGDYYWSCLTGGYCVYEKMVDEDWSFVIGVSCEGKCNTDAQTKMAANKWSLSYRGSGVDFENNELVLVCTSGCPPAQGSGAWPAMSSSTTWTTPNGEGQHPSALECGAAPMPCHTAMTLTGFGIHDGFNYDADYYVANVRPTNLYYDARFSDQYDGELSVGCSPKSGTPEETKLCQGRWTMVRRGNDHHFGEVKLLAICMENCPSISVGPPGFVAGTSRWQMIGGNELEVKAECCKRKADTCDKCDEADCRAHTNYVNWFGESLPQGCTKDASPCCYNNHDQVEFGHCGCKPVGTVCDHGDFSLVV